MRCTAAAPPTVEAKPRPGEKKGEAKRVKKQILHCTSMARNC